MTESRKLRVVLFKSRNKDNRQLSGFKERVVNFVSTRSNGELVGEFEHFAQQGLPGELSRMYVSANARSNDKVKKSLVSHLVEHDDVNMAALPQLVASKASLSKNRAESKWLFDYDDSFDNLSDFLEDVEHYSKNKQGQSVECETYRTPNGHAVVVSRGFDTRELLAKWENVDLMRDGMLCVKWMQV